MSVGGLALTRQRGVVELIMLVLVYGVPSR